MNSKILCCHAAYEYKSVTGECVFNYGEYHSDVILREDMTNRKDIYIRVSLLLSLYCLASYSLHIFS